MPLQICKRKHIDVEQIDGIGYCLVKMLVVPLQQMIDHLSSRECIPAYAYFFVHLSSCRESHYFVIEAK